MKSSTASPSDCIQPSRGSLLDRLVDVNELARELGISRHTVYGWVAQRRIPFLKVGRLLRFDNSSIRRIEAWLREQAEAPVAVEDEPPPALDTERCRTRPERRS